MVIKCVCPSRGHHAVVPGLSIKEHQTEDFFSPLIMLKWDSERGILKLEKRVGYLRAERNARLME